MKRTNVIKLQKYVFLLTVILLLLANKHVYSWTSDTGYVQIERYTDEIITDENGLPITTKSPLDDKVLIMEPGKNYYYKMSLINNAEGYWIYKKKYSGKIRFSLKSYGSSEEVEIQSFDVSLKEHEIKEYKLILSDNYYKGLKTDEFYINIEYYDNVINMWMPVTSYKNKYGRKKYDIFFNNQKFIEKYQNYDPIKKQFN